MKLKNLFIAILIFPVLPACKKDNNGNTAPSLVAKWNLVTDHTANHLGEINTYTGVPGDYFDFRSNGKCYVKEGDQYDTLSYAITSDTTIAIQRFGFNNAAYYSSKASRLTVHGATITSAGPYPPGEVDYRQVNLSR